MLSCTCRQGEPAKTLFHKERGTGSCSCRTRDRMNHPCQPRKKTPGTKRSTGREKHETKTEKRFPWTRGPARELVPVPEAKVAQAKGRAKIKTASQGNNKDRGKGKNTSTERNSDVFQFFICQNVEKWVASTLAKSSRVACAWFIATSACCTSVRSQSFTQRCQAHSRHSPAHKSRRTCEHLTSQSPPPHSSIHQFRRS